ncbi:hypothetical protein [Brachybacterium hainanense]|uniref:Uncharacterized protein n=1 Tax=Brachybacterium hainanense TaxID=1541174 RepID=A0ABV6R7J7_9MICO
MEPFRTHHDVDAQLRAEGWTPCGKGDWAYALASPDGTRAARISPFDPVGPFTARLYREAAASGRVPHLVTHERLRGGADLQIMELLLPVPAREAAAFLAALPREHPALLAVVDRVHALARAALPWCGPLDTNPSNVMRRADGILVLADPYYADGPDLYATAERDPDLLVARIPEQERRHMTEIPLAESGPWPEEQRMALRERIRQADARAARHRRTASRKHDHEEDGS